MSTKKKALLASVMGTAIVLGLAVSVPATAAVEGKISAVDGGGRSVTVDGKKFKVSGSRTKIMVAGKEAEREQLKKGMQCKVEGDDEASMIDCK